MHPPMRAALRGRLVAGLVGVCGCVLIGAAGAAPVAADRIEDAAALALFEAFGGGLELQPVGAGAAPQPPGAAALSARLPSGARLARRMVAYVDMTVDGQPWRSVPVWFAVRAPRPVLAARVALRAGEAPAADALQTELRDVTAYAAPTLAPDAPLSGLRLRAPLPAGAVLTQAHVEARPAVARHEVVQVTLRAGAVELETTGVALADARIGERLRVLNPASQQSYVARVVADGAVQAEAR